MKRLLTSILLIAFLAGAVSAQQLTGTLQQINETGQVKIGYRTIMPPLSFMGKDNTPVGYSVDLCNHIVKQIEKKIDKEIKTVWVPVTSENRFKAMAVRRNDADFRLAADAAISDLYRSNEILELHDKWVGKFVGQRTPAFEVLVRLNAIPE